LIIFGIKTGNKYLKMLFSNIGWNIDGKEFLKEVTVLL